MTKEFFLSVFELVLQILTCCLLEKAISIFQGRPFNKKYAFAIWMAYIALLFMLDHAVRTLSVAWKEGPVNRTQIVNLVPPKK